MGAAAVASYPPSDQAQAMPACELCQREVDEITTHHLIPRTRHKHKKSKKGFMRDGAKSRPVALCRPCHNQVHMLPNKEVKYYF
jgi:hypothetical protein